ncbi:MAG: hypothetical protein IH626_05485 [Rhodospirillales bacterium]|nr:hypothetical protein [Rhodospirillales bacterium]
MNCRQLPQTDYLRLKAAFRELTKAAGGQEAAAAVSRLKSHVTIGRYGRIQDAEFAPIDVVADLEAEIGEAPVTRALAALAGLIVIPRPPVDANEEITRHLGAIAKEAGDAISRIGEALADDGRVSAAEIARLSLREEVAQVMEAAARMDKLLERIEAEGRR